jgi:O-antigen ligase/polysaccharide polymerase Wzy-like membrane protein
MRRVTWILLLVLAFAIPWEYSLDLGEGWGNIARIVCLMACAVALVAVLQAGRLRTPGPLLGSVLALYVWNCCSYLWSIVPLMTAVKMRGFLQEMVIVWLVWEFTESASDLRALMRAYMAGNWVLALLTVASFATARAAGTDQVRFAAEGFDPNDAARFLVLGFPFAALLFESERKRAWRLAALMYLPVGLIAVLLTASRTGFLLAGIGLAGCGLMLAGRHLKGVVISVFSLPVGLGAVWLTVPHSILERLSSIPAQIQSMDLNQRRTIWEAGWRAFGHSPIVGTGAGSFASAAGLNPLDTAHDTALSILADGGLMALALFCAVAFLTVRAMARTRKSIRGCLGVALMIWFVACLVATVEENRATWFLIGLIAAAWQVSESDPDGVDALFLSGFHPGARAAGWGIEWHSPAQLKSSSVVCK